LPVTGGCVDGNPSHPLRRSPPDILPNRRSPVLSLRMLRSRLAALERSHSRSVYSLPALPSYPTTDMWKYLKTDG